MYIVLYWLFCMFVLLDWWLLCFVICVIKSLFFSFKKHIKCYIRFRIFHFFIVCSYKKVKVDIIILSKSSNVVDCYAKEKVKKMILKIILLAVVACIATANATMIKIKNMKDPEQGEFNLDVDVNASILMLKMRIMSETAAVAKGENFCLSYALFC